MGENKLLKLINEDEAIREAIRNICNEKGSPLITQEEVGDKERYEHAVQQHAKDEKEIVMFKAMVAKLKQCFADEQEKTGNLTQDLSELQQRLTDDIAQLERQKEELTSTNQQLQQQTQSLSTTNEKLSFKKEELSTTNKQLNSNIQVLQFDNTNIQDENKNLHQTIDFYKENFEDDLTAYEHFTSLSPTTKKSIAGIFKDTSLKGFLACGVQDKNIASFWEYIKTEIQEDRSQDTEKLITIYNFLFDRYRIAFPIYEQQKVAIDDEFDSLEHIRHSHSQAVSGRISKVLLMGYMNNKTSKIIKQSVVKLG